MEAPGGWGQPPVTTRVGSPSVCESTTSTRSGQVKVTRGASDLLGDRERRPVAARQERVRLGVAHELLELAVELQLAGDAVGDVREVRERRGEMAVLDAAGEDLGVVGLDRVHEVAIVRPLL